MSVIPEAVQPPTGTLIRLAPWALGLLVVALTVATVVVFPGTPRDFPASAYAISLPWGITCSLIGSLIASRRRGGLIGWLLVILGVVVAVMMLAARGGETDHPAAIALNILSDVLFLLAFSLLPILVFLFPDGRPLSRRWGRVVWFAALWPVALFLLVIAFAPQEILSEERTSPVQVVLSVFLVLTLGASAASALVRYARSAGVERQQLKWFAYATAVGFAWLILGSLLPGEWTGISNLGLYGPLVGIAVALFRYRLYDIDTLINRTFVYGSLVAILAGLYAASVRLFNAVFVGVTGVGSEEVLVITTLILATAFTPIKKRLEEIVERRYKKPSGGGAASPGEPGSAGIPDPALIEAIDARVRTIVRDELARSRRAT